MNKINLTISVSLVALVAGAGCMSMAGYERGVTIPYKEAFQQKGHLADLVEKEIEAGNIDRAYHALELMRTRTFVSRRIAAQRRQKIAPEYKQLKDYYTQLYQVDLTPAEPEAVVIGADAQVADTETIDKTAKPEPTDVIDEIELTDEEKQAEAEAQAEAAPGIAVATRGFGGIDKGMRGKMFAAREADDELFWKDYRKLEKRLKSYEDAASYTELSYRQIFKNRYVVTSTLDVKLSLSPGEAVVEYFLGRKGSYCFVIKSDSVKLIKLPMSAARITKGVRVLVSRLASTNLVGEGDTSWMATSQKLYEVVFAPVVAELAGVESLYVVPYGSLSTLPFGALLAGKDAGSALIKKYRISYLPSFSVLKNILTRKLPKKPPRLMAVGNPKNVWAEMAGKGPLAAAAREAETVANVFPQGKLLRGKVATESAFWAAYKKYNIWHFATHGLLGGLDTQASALLFSDADAANDGFLSAAEIGSLKLDGSYVAVLSACETAVTFKRGGNDDLGSLTGAFLSAGVPAVVGSFWPVEDNSTTELMLGFYSKFLEVGTSEALRQAQLALMAQDKYKHPYYWAAFALFGFDK